MRPFLSCALCKVFHLSAFEIPEDAPEEQKRALKQIGHIFNRLDKTQTEFFEKVNLNKHLCELHISNKAGQCFDVLVRVRHLVWAAAHMMIVDNTLHLPPEKALEQAERRIAYQFDIYERRNNGIPDARDYLSRVLDEAWEVLQKEARSALRPSSFVQFLFGWWPKAKPTPWSAEAKKALMISD